MESEGEGNVSSFHGLVNGGAQKEQWNMDKLGEVGNHQVCFGNLRVHMLNDLMDIYIWVLSSEEKSV